MSMKISYNFIPQVRINILSLQQSPQLSAEPVPGKVGFVAIHVDIHGQYESQQNSWASRYSLLGSKVEICSL